MRLIVIPDRAEGDDRAEPARLKHAMSAHPLSLLVVEAARRAFYSTDEPGSLGAGVDSNEPADIAWLVPPPWNLSLPVGEEQVLHANSRAVIEGRTGKELLRHPWLVMSDGRFVTQTNTSLLHRVLARTRADVIAVRVNPQLRAHRERIRLTPQGELVGCRRLYRDVAEPIPMHVAGPHHVFIRSRCAAKVLGDDWARNLSEILARCQTLGLKIRFFAIAGTEIDLAASQGLLTLSRWMLCGTPPSGAVSSLLYTGPDHRTDLHAGVSPEARLVGPILLGSGVRVEAGAVVIGPAVLCSDSTIGPQALVDASIVGQGISVDPGRRLTGACVLTPQAESAQEPDGAIAAVAAARCATSMHPRSEFRMWPKFSYARSIKRVADIITAFVVIVLFAPIIPFIALAIRINSPGPIFYRDWRQGLHGRPFHCIKFRTMRVGAAAIQDKLRFVSEVDGPQFKINDDPRISGVGRFLRETSVDEIPQFFNVLVGQMSVVGPRPSPEAENTQCPSWRDARLSVRPGITGLWQVRRTRQPFKDFQEWIYYDTKYAGNYRCETICGFVDRQSGTCSRASWSSSKDSKRKNGWHDNTSTGSW